MKLDNDLVRDILLQVETDVDGYKNHEIISYCKEKFPGCEVRTAEYHMKYLGDAGFIQGSTATFRDITPAGRDFLNNIRDDGIWADTKKAIKPLGTVALDVVAEIAASIAKKTFNLP